MPLVICVVSRTKGRGKTALIERLTKSLTSEGFGVATVKHISGSFDTAKKDTWRHLEAGAVITVATTSDEIVTITRTRNPPLERVLSAIYIKLELVIVEGYKRSSYPKILCADTAEEADAAVKEIPNIVMVSGLVSSNAEQKARFESKFPKIPVYDFVEVISALKEMLADSILKGLPGLNCKHCGYDSCREFAKAILSGEATMRQCEVLATDIATLKVDGKTVPMGKFPQQIIRGVTLGILETLKGVRKHPHRIEILVNADVEEGADE
ncbi:MAG: molybdopterin-guanine dinucleotide biosynthesis protein B [Candidatus Bathyarchaeota archaeon]|nr:molybdopterin-guanine dinucleotide biosynthesis protein B [Candidatus Bathyarchaeota archaeon]